MTIQAQTQVGQPARRDAPFVLHENRRGAAPVAVVDIVDARVEVEIALLQAYIAARFNAGQQAVIAPAGPGQLPFAAPPVGARFVAVGGGEGIFAVKRIAAEMHAQLLVQRVGQGRGMGQVDVKLSVLHEVAWRIEHGAVIGRGHILPTPRKRRAAAPVFPTALEHRLEVALAVELVRNAVADPGRVVLGEIEIVAVALVGADPGHPVEAGSGASAREQAGAAAAAVAGIDRHAAAVEIGAGPQHGFDDAEQRIAAIAGGRGAGHQQQDARVVVAGPAETAHAKVGVAAVVAGVHPARRLQRLADVAETEAAYVFGGNYRGGGRRFRQRLGITRGALHFDTQQILQLHAGNIIRRKERRRHPARRDEPHRKYQPELHARGPNDRIPRARILRSFAPYAEQFSARAEAVPAALHNGSPLPACWPRPALPPAPESGAPARNG